MKTKTSILAALVAMASSATLMAQVYSLNVVGYANVPISSGLTMLSNPLNTTNNTLGSLLPTVPDFTTIYKWNGSTYDIATFFFGSWDHPEYSLNPGEGVFYYPGNSTATSLTFVGEVLQGSLTNPIPAGLSMRSSQVPQAGPIDTLGLTNVSDFDTIYKWNTGTQNYDTYTFFFGSWSPSAPNLSVGESIFYFANNATSWNRNFNPNQ